MTTTGIQRDLGKDGGVVLKDARCSFTFRASPGVLARWSSSSRA